MLLINLFYSIIFTETIGSVSSTWIGASDAVTEGDWKWTNGESITFTNWYSGRPNNWGGRQACATINFKSSGKWDDDTCTTQHPYICQGVQLTIPGRSLTSTKY